jgi:hypothetical protein
VEDVPYTHRVVAVAEDNSMLKQAAMLGEFHPGMEVIAWCCSASDAGVTCRALQARDSTRQLFVIPGRKHPIVG